MKDLDVGFIKDSSSELTFAGANTYEGNTIIKGGSLRLINENALKRSKTYIEKGASLVFDTKKNNMDKDLYNEGLVWIGGKDKIAELNIQGKYAQNGQDSILKINFAQTAKSKLNAQNYDIKGGKLQYVPIDTFYTKGQEIKISFDELEPYVDKLTVEVVDTYATKFSTNIKNNQEGKKRTYRYNVSCR